MNLQTLDENIRLHLKKILDIEFGLIKVYMSENTFERLQTPEWGEDKPYFQWGFTTENNTFINPFTECVVEISDDIQDGNIEALRY